MEPNNNEQNYRNLAAALLIADLVMVIIVIKNGFHMGSQTERIIYTLLFWVISTAMNVFWNKATEETEDWSVGHWAMQLLYPAAFAAAMFFMMK